MAGRKERVEPLDRADHLSSLGGEVEAVARGDRSMQQCPAATAICLSSRAGAQKLRIAGVRRGIGVAECRVGPYRSPLS